MQNTEFLNQKNHIGRHVNEDYKEAERERKV